MAFLPTGTITFLFTDIEGSTRLWDAHSALMRPALERHDALMREAIYSAGGVVFKTVGDAFCAAFASAPAALEAATEAQSALLGEPWPEQTPLKVRMALHTGIAQERDGDYFGPVLNRVARLLSAGHGGQTLVSAPTYELVRDHLSGGAVLQDLGSHRLKDLERPEHVYQVSVPGLPGAFAPLKTLDTTPNNLPPQLTSFIGREKAIADTTALLAKTRLLTLTGSGGSGKSRLSLQVAADALDGYPDGAWLVELAPLADPSLVPQTVAQVLGVKEAVGQSLTQSLTSTLKDKSLLLLLDNCEHLLQACAGFVAALLRACPTVRIIATSREPLGIAGEQTYRVPSLTLPNPQQGKKATVDSLSQFEAVRLFIERGQAVKPDFVINNQNAPALAQLCYRLDGIPLAIELAAARVRSLAVEQINDKLDTRFRILTGGDKSALPRQQTLRALVDWSYDLLTDAEKTLFARLSVFAGGWTLEAAERVCGWEPVEDWEVLDLLTSLADKSLIVADEAEGETRYRMLETLKQYGAEKRDANGESGEVKTKHRDYFVELAEEGEPHLTGPEQTSWLNRLETEHDNLRAAMDDCATPRAEAEEEAAAQEAGLRLVGALWRFWYTRGYLSEGREQAARALERGLGLGPQTQKLRALAASGAGYLAYNQGDNEAACRLYEESLALCRDCANKSGIAFALNGLASVAHEQCNYEKANSLYTESLALYREVGVRFGIASVLGNLGLNAFCQGDYRAARTLCEEGLAGFRESGDKGGIAMVSDTLGRLAINQGDHKTAYSLYQESLALRRELGDKQGITRSLYELGNVAYYQRDYGAARSLFEEYLILSRELHSKEDTACALFNLGYVDNKLEKYSSALLLHAESLALMRDLKSKGYIVYCLEGFAFVFSKGDTFRKAVVLFGAASALRESLGAPRPPSDQVDYDAALASARSALGEAAFSEASEQGRTMDWEQAADYALQQNPA